MVILILTFNHPTNPEMVNTFLTSSDFVQSAKNLDRARLGKQRVEPYQVLNLIQDIKLLAPLLDVRLTLHVNVKI